MPAQIISGGQTGADRGGLEAAMELGIGHGGWCPKGRIAEDGVIPKRYKVHPTESPRYDVRTKRNVREADATVLFTVGRPEGGDALTLRDAKYAEKPALHLDLSKVTYGAAAKELRKWAAKQKIVVLNVAGSRESVAPGLQHVVHGILMAAFR
jgi:hypothetical protein